MLRTLIRSLLLAGTGIARFQFSKPWRRRLHEIEFLGNLMSLFASPKKCNY